MRRAVILPAIVAALGAVTAQAGPVSFQLVSQSLQVDRAAKNATFRLTFNQAPDFALAPGDGQANAFQYEIDSDWSGGGSSADIGFADIDSVIRGSEIWEGAGLPIRQRDGAGGPNAGGWGPVRDAVPFQSSGNTVSFVTSFKDLGDTDGTFRYRVFTTDHGAVTSHASGTTIPLPSAFLSGLTVLGGMGLARRFKRRRR